MKCSLGIFHFIEEISNLSHSVVFLFLCTDHWGRLSYLSLLFFGTLHSSGYIFPFLFCFSLLFFSQLFVRPAQTPFCFFQFSSVTQSCPTLCDPMNHSMPALLSITSSWSLLSLMSIEVVMPSSPLFLCRPLLLPPPIPPNIRVFSNESALPMRWPEYWSFSFSFSPSNEHPGLISFRMDWLDLLAVHGTLKILLQHHSSEASILWRSTFFTVPTLISIRDHWKNHSRDGPLVTKQCLCFLICYLGWS